MHLSQEQILAQSKNAYAQWAGQWREHAKIHATWVQNSLTDFENYGVGRAILLVANGYSFEDQIDSIKKYRDNVDIMACDKTLGSLIEHDITPDFCLVADANVDFDKYCKKWSKKLNNTILFMNVCGNPKWTANANWNKVYFFANEDVLGSQHEFQFLSQCPNCIPAGTNVSNAMVIFVTQCNNNGRRNYFGYDKILLIGFDYSFKEGYYAFDKTGNGKVHYMNHEVLKRLDDEFCYTSGNLIFSAKWLTDYITTFKLPVIQCTDKTILSLPYNSTLQKQMQYDGKREDNKKVFSIMRKKKALRKKIADLDGVLMEIGYSHLNDFLATV